MRSLSLFCLFLAALGCASSAPEVREARVSAYHAGLDPELLADLHFRFTDFEAPGTGVYESTGPYRVLSAREDQIELIGFDPLNFRPTYTTLLLEGEQIWARVRIGEQRFLARVR